MWDERTGTYWVSQGSFKENGQYRHSTGKGWLAGGASFLWGSEQTTDAVVEIGCSPWLLEVLWALPKWVYEIESVQTASPVIGCQAVWPAV